MTLTPDDTRHGTATGYLNHGCRCDQCRAQGRIINARRNARYTGYKRPSRAKNPVPTPAPPCGEWADNAACKGRDAAIFYPVGPGGHGGATDYSQAIAICRSCPVQAACLAHALEHSEDGCWGGTTPQQRRRITAARRAI